MLPRKMKAIMIAGITSHSVNLRVNRFIYKGRKWETFMSVAKWSVYACHTRVIHSMSK